VNNARLTPGILVAALLVGVAWGPLTTLRAITVSDMTSEAYWQGLLAATIQSAASAVLATISLIAGVVGLPLLRRGAPPP
jgi:hypothetical protein